MKSACDITVRLGVAEDIASAVALSRRKRQLYEKVQPCFWRRAAKADEIQRDWFTSLLQRDDYIFCVAEQKERIVGFIIGQIVQAPEVYAPPGRVLMIDDFCVTPQSAWDRIGSQLLLQIKKHAKTKGVKQFVVVCGAHDALKHAFLKQHGLAIVSEWHLGEI